MFCVKLIDNTGNEHLILVLDKYAKIEVEDGSRIVKYESDGKANILFGNDKLREADYDIDGPKVVGIDCTTRKSFITDLDMFDLLYKKECGVNEICELGLYSNLPKAYYTESEEDDTLGLLALRFIKKVRTAFILDEEQSDSAQCLLYKYDDGVSTITTIISKDDSLRGIVLSTKSGGNC